MFKVKIPKILVLKLSPIICAYPLNRKTRLLLYICLEDSKSIKDIIFALQKVNPCASREVINESKHISGTKKGSGK